MKYTNDLKEAVIALLLFKQYTIFPRWMEICYSLLFYCTLFLTIFY